MTDYFASKGSRPNPKELLNDPQKETCSPMATDRCRQRCRAGTGTIDRPMFRPRRLGAGMALGLLLAIAAPGAFADIQDEFNDCQFNRLPKLKKFGFRSEDPVDQFCIGYAYWHGFVYNPEPSQSAPRTRDPYRASQQGQIPHDPVASAQWMARAAAQGHPGAQTLLAYYYEQGHGVPKDYAQTLFWLRKAVAQNYPAAMFHMGRLYSTGKGVPQDQEMARQWFRKAAAAGSSDAAVALREDKQYEQEKPGHDAFERAYQAYAANDYARAAALYREAADAGNVSAMSALGTLQRTGLGVPKNPQAAVQLYRQAAAKGSARAKAQLGFAYEFGEGVAADWTQAAKWCAESARESDRLGLYCLGRDYQFGIGVPQDRERAIHYFDLAAAQGNDDQSKFFHEWLRNPTNCIGMRNEYEREHFFGVCEEPRGVAFTSEQERSRWLATWEAKHQAEALRLWHAMHGSGQGTGCGAAGGTWSGGNCHGDGSIIFDPMQQDRHGRPLW
jgi:TPR repeat protein